MRKNRWNTIGRTRHRLAEILTTYVRATWPDAHALCGLTVHPENIYPMRLAGRAREWEDAHSWECSVTANSGNPLKMLQSYSTMTECVRYGVVSVSGNHLDVHANN